MSRCRVCGFENPEGMRFCGNCGNPLEAAPRAEERKLVTVLFVDVVGSTQTAVALDPERVHARMQRFFAIAQEEIERFGGTVEKFIGDAVAAVFGLPTVHEDDAERAARAALAIRQRIAPEVIAGMLPPVRMGINTGEIVANPRGLEKGEFLMTGEAVNLAARLQQHAAPGQILVGDRTSGLLRGGAVLRPVPPLQVKGVDRPLAAWELDEIGVPRERELGATPFVGREEELLLLESFLRRIRREARGHTVTILGPAGVGKTRLIREFRTRADGVRILRGRALPYGTGVPFWSVGEAIREHCGILFGDSIEVAITKLTREVERLAIPQVAGPLRSVLALGDPGGALAREELFSGMRVLFQALSRERPLLLVLEDMHSAEDVTIDFLEQAADWCRDIPLLQLILSRPELLERRPQWMGGKRSATTLVLEPLSGDESRVLMDGILGGRPLPDGVREQLISRAEGNPLFLEEMLRALIEQGILVERGDWALTVPEAQLIIPDTIHAVIAARVDALPPAEKQVLQAAAVQGKDFWLGAVREIAGTASLEDAVAALVSKELLIHKLRSTVLGEEELTFRHILIRDVAYATISKASREQMHRQVAGWMERIAGDRRAEFADFVAHHWLQVVTLHHELGLAPDRDAQRQAVAALSAAAGRAAAVYAMTTALDHYTRALDLAPDPAERLPLLEGRGRAWMFLAQWDRAREDFTALAKLAREMGQASWEVIALDHIGHSFRREDRIEEALGALDPALALARRLGDPQLTARVLNHIGFTYFSDGRNEDALGVHQEAHELLAGHDDPEAVTESVHGLGENLFFLGRFREALENLQASMEMSAATGNRSLAGENQFMIAAARHALGDYPSARADAAGSLATLTEIGDIRNLSVALWTAAMIDLSSGEIGRALASALKGAQLAREIRAPRFLVYSLGGIAEARRELEDPAGAEQTGREAVSLAETLSGAAWKPLLLAGLILDAIELNRLDDGRQYLAEAWKDLERTQTRSYIPQELLYVEGRLTLARGDRAAAREAARKLAALVADSGTVRWRPMVRLLEAGVAWSDGSEQAVALYTDVVREAEAAGRLPLQWRTLAARADAEKALGRATAARESARAAKEIIDRIAGGVADEPIRATFLQSARVQRIITLAGL
jgi:class 3 adenylate cyclase/tetratricopeptide (TPR) repeat protein